MSKIIIGGRKGTAFEWPGQGNEGWIDSRVRRVSTQQSLELSTPPAHALHIVCVVRIFKFAHLHSARRIYYLYVIMTRIIICHCRFVQSFH